MKAGDFILSFDQALTGKKFREASRLLDDLEPGRFTDTEAVAVLDALKANRRFADLERAASLFLVSGKREPTIRRHWAQSMLDQNRIAPAMDVLRHLYTETQKNSSDASEVIGLIGRGHKQRYVNEHDPQDLHKAIDAYLDGWEMKDGDHRWHGVNLLALSNRANMDGIELAQDIDSNGIAKRILTEVKELNDPKPWDCAAGMEASLVLGQKDGMEQWAKRFISHPGSDAFELGSALRQMKQVWQLEGTEFGQSFFPVFEYELLHSEGGEVRITSSENIADRSGFEAIYGGEAYTRIEWMDNLRSRMISIARVQHPVTGQPFGTGFVIRGGDIRSDWGDKLMFVTNAHVVSDQSEDRAPLRPERACAKFTLIKNRPQYKLGKKVFHSGRTKLDVWICEIEIQEDISHLGLSFFNPLLPQSANQKERCFVAGHPHGDEIVVSLFDNALVGIREPYVHYRSPTASGSSGSPVFNRGLDVFALHHRARDELEANEGVSLRYIQEAAKS